MKEIIRKLSSRKLWLAIGGVATGIAIALGADGGDIETIAGAITSIVSVIAYIITEGKIDAESVKKAVTSTQDDVEVIKGENE